LIIRCIRASLLGAILLGGSAALWAADAPLEESNPVAASAPQLLVMLHRPAPHFRPDNNYGSQYDDGGGRVARRRIAQELARAHGLKVVNDWPMPVLGVDCYVMEQVAGTSLEQVAHELEHDSRVEWVQPMHLYHGLAQEDPLYPVQPSAKFWHIAEIHKFSTGRDVSVALIDSGVEQTHPDLIGQVALKENFVDGIPYAAEVHGTAVAGIIAARTGNGVGIIGVAPNAHIMALRACWEDPTHASQCSSFTVGKALNFAIQHHANIINMSLAGPPDKLLERLLEIAATRGTAIVAAVDPSAPDGGFPASLPGVIGVTGQDAVRASDRWLAAPGNDIPTTLPGERWGFVSGSSYAAAHVSGMIALMLELRPKIKPEETRELLVGSVVNSTATLVSRAIDACATVSRLNRNCICSCAVTNMKASNYP
jgi:subtilisin family serine protease